MIFQKYGVPRSYVAITADETLSKLVEIHLKILIDLGNFGCPSCYETF